MSLCVVDHFKFHLHLTSNKEVSLICVFYNCSRKLLVYFLYSFFYLFIRKHRKPRAESLSERIKQFRLVLLHTELVPVRLQECEAHPVQLLQRLLSTQLHAVHQPHHRGRVGQAVKLVRRLLYTEPATHRQLGQSALSPGLHYCTHHSTIILATRNIEREIINFAWQYNQRHLVINAC